MGSMPVPGKHCKYNNNNFPGLFKLVVKVRLKSAVMQAGGYLKGLCDD